MDTLTGIFTIRPYNPASFLIRVANPVSVTTLAPASHVLTLDGDTGFCFEANMLKNRVHRVTVEDAIRGAIIVERIDYEVPNAAGGLKFLRDTVDRKATYDYKGALGLGLAPNRNWQEDSDWFCFELHTMALERAGRKTFRKCSRVSSHLLMSLSPEFRPPALLAA